MNIGVVTIFRLANTSLLQVYCSIFSIFKVFWSGHDLFWSNVEQGWIVHGFCSGLILKKWFFKIISKHTSAKKMKYMTTSGLITDEYFCCCFHFVFASLSLRSLKVSGLLVCDTRYTTAEEKLRACFVRKYFTRRKKYHASSHPEKKFLMHIL